MIWDKTQDYKEKVKKYKSKTITEQCVESKLFKRLNNEQLKKFLDQHEIIHCVYYMDDGTFSYSKMLKVYFLLFQVSIKFSTDQSLYNFLVQQNFSQKISQNIPQSACVGQKIILGKICNFLDSFKNKRCIKFQINSLVNEYHEYRLLDNWREISFIVETCDIIKQYLYQNMNFLINQLQYTESNAMNDEVFLNFYQHYSELCTICKRISYIKCRMMELPIFQISSSIRLLIQQKHIKIIKNTNNNQNKQLQIQSIFKPQLIKINEKAKLNVKKKLKAMSSIINQMQQHET